MYDLDKDHTLFFSEDDETETGKGFYVQKFPEGKTSQLFKTGQEAIDALKFNELKFD